MTNKQRHRDISYPGRSVVMSTGAMVATSQPMATQAALDILRKGGNAMDAAIAASATLCVTEPQATGIGGDCFILYHDAQMNALHGLNGSGRAPARASVEEYRSRGFSAMPERGVLSVTVPGAVHAWDTALERFGRMDLKDVLQAAIHYAEDGYAVSPIVAGCWKQDEDLLAANESARKALLINGKAPACGSRYQQPQLARSLRLIAAQGAAAFYKGSIAEQIVHYSKQHDGLLAMDDFAEHTSDWVNPIATDYKGLRVFEIPPNGQGITALMTLNILEQADLVKMPHLGVDHIHTLSEAFRLATAERNRFICDPDFNDIPIDTLLSKSFAQQQWTRINASKLAEHPVTSGLPNHKDTVYLTVVDEQRNVASLINSVFYQWGSGVVAGDTGIVLQNRGSGFVLDENHANCIAPRKRPMHTIIPAMVYKNDQPVLSFGVMGGHYQALGQCYVLSNWLDYDMDLQEAVDAPRFMPEGNSLFVEKRIPQKTREALSRRGHDVIETAIPMGGAQCVQIDWLNGVLQAASDPRKDGCALGY